MSCLGNSDFLLNFVVLLEAGIPIYSYGLITAFGKVKFVCKKNEFLVINVKLQKK